ncbi:protein of unknown function [Pararobbsia alpina]
MSVYHRNEQSTSEVRPVPVSSEFKTLSPVCQEILRGVRFSEEEINRIWAEARRKTGI